MVLSRGPGLHSCLFRYGLGHGTGPGLPILRSCSTQVCPVYDLGVYGFFLDHYLPMVFLGLLSGFQRIRNQRIHRKLRTLWSDAHSWNAISWIPSHSGALVLILPASILRRYSSNYYGCRCCAFASFLLWSSSSHGPRS